MKKLMKKLIAMVAALVMIVTFLPAMGVNAGTGRNGGTITIYKNIAVESGDGETEIQGISGAIFTIYQLASINHDSRTETWTYTVNSAYESILGDIENEDLNKLPSSAWENSITSLANVNRADTEEGVYKTNASGTNGYTNSVDVPLGIYLVKETTTPDGYVAGKPFIVSVPSTNNYDEIYGGDTEGTSLEYDIVAKPKNTEMPISKTTTDEDLTAGIGDLVPYTITTAIPNYGSEYTNPTFNIYDIMGTGLELDRGENDSLQGVTVTVNGTNVAAGENTYRVNYNVSIQGSTDVKTFEIVFDSAYIKEHTNQSVVITYNGRVTKDAVYTIGNDAYVTYSNNPGTTDDEGTPGPDIHTFGIDLTKVGVGNDVDGLNGATFTLSDNVSDKTISFTVNNGNVQVEGSDMVTASIGTGDDEEKGKLVIRGLAAGTYTLTETKSPSGYTLLANPINIEIIVNADGTFKEANMWTDDETDKTPITVTSTDVAEVLVPVRVENNKGFTLPSTGGMGTYLFTIGGIVIMAGAAFALIAMKKRA